MKHYLKSSFLKIANEIIEQHNSLNEWAAIESDDMFQEGIYVGGFDATEMEFCFNSLLASPLDPRKPVFAAKAAIISKPLLMSCLDTSAWGTPSNTSKNVFSLSFFRSVEVDFPKRISLAFSALSRSSCECTITVTSSAKRF